MCKHQRPSIALGEILQPVPAIQPSALISTVAELFASDPSLFGLAVVENGSFLGVVRKTKFYRSLSRVFGWELYSRRPIRLLVESNLISMEPGIDINDALSALLKTDPKMSIDSFPVVSEGACLGMVTVSSLMMNISLIQARLLQTLEEFNERICEEVTQAARIQQALLPLRNFCIPGITLAADLVTSSEVGGDFFDYFVFKNQRLCMLIADASGHGIQAGMVTTAAKASLYTLVNQGVTTPAGLLCGMNRAILATVRQNAFMTCFIAIIDFEQQCFTYANAGHPFPYLYKKETNSLAMLQRASGFPLGFDEFSNYLEHIVLFSPGDRLILYSDGVNECSNGADAFGFQRLENCLMTASDMHPQQLARRVIDSLLEFNENKKLEDDVTLLIAKFEENTVNSS